MGSRSKVFAAHSGSRAPQAFSSLSSWPFRLDERGRFSRTSLACLAAAGVLLGGCVPAAAGNAAPGPGELGTAELLADLIRIPSVNPPGGEGPVADRIAAELSRAGLEVRVIPTPRSSDDDPPRAAVWARLPGRGARRPLILLSHLDVVPANPKDWSRPPFAGVVEDGIVYGRGALDAKGVSAVHASVLIALAGRDERLDRDVILLATPDEETGGLAGARYIVKQHPELLADAEYLLTEGGSIRPAREGREGMPPVPPLWGVTVTEKGPCWLELETRGPSGHGSAPRPGSAVPRLIEALDRVRRIESPIHVQEPVAAMFRHLAPSAPREDREGFAALAHGLETDSSFRRRFLANPGYNALVRNTIAITVLASGANTNVVPGEARARLDVRLLPGEDCAEFVAALKAVIADPEVEVETLLSFPSRSSPGDTPLFDAIARVARREDPGAVVLPRMIGGFTDAHWFRQEGIVAYGFVPRRLSRADTRGVHGVDEAVSIQNLEAGVSTLLAIIDELQALTPGPIAAGPPADP